MVKKKLSAIEVFKDLPIGEYAELAIDVAIDDETLKSIPVISTAHGMYKAFGSFRKESYDKKSMHFLKQQAKA